jgi:flavin-binding protein dodecin
MDPLDQHVDRDAQPAIPDLKHRGVVAVADQQLPTGDVEVRRQPSDEIELAHGEAVSHPDDLPRSGRTNEEGAAVPVLNTIELEGVSAESWMHAAHEALREAGKTLRNIERLDILGTSATVDGTGVLEYHTQVRLYFAVEPR